MSAEKTEKTTEEEDEVEDVSAEKTGKTAEEEEVSAEKAEKNTEEDEEKDEEAENSPLLRPHGSDGQNVGPPARRRTVTSLQH